MKPLIRYSLLSKRFFLLTRYTTKTMEDRNCREYPVIVASKKVDITAEVLNLNAADIRRARKVQAALHSK